jgi:integrase
VHKTERQRPPPCPFREIRSTRSHDSRVGITPLRRLYDLRHTFATFALRAGIPTFDLSRFMAPASDHDRPVDAAWTPELAAAASRDNGNAKVSRGEIEAL